ncbi:RNA polymerase II subunit B1 CTD phosphatase Rpap2-like [Lineus longissimus]|uniref:RNA polymerase II subunit B1 CTD phosphatase Rpap2-like n=1 Tax=Lineus longissimus TaxID=88925 RepID=UPI002B4F5488
MSAAKAPKQADEVTQRKREEVLKQLQKQKECENRAVKIVERLLEENITEEFLKDSAQLITPSHYADVNEERNIARLCGYPVCSKSLGPIPKQKYHISTKHNKVYDITDRKKFCSNQCYQASRHFERQISTAPLFLRDKEQPVRFTLLPLQQTSGKAGEEVVTNPLVDLREELMLLGLDDCDEVQQTSSASAAGHCEDVDGIASDSKGLGKVVQELDSDDDDDDDDGKEVGLGHLETENDRTEVTGQGVPWSLEGRGGNGDQVESVEDKMKKLMEMIDKRDKLIADLKEGKLDHSSEEQKVRPKGSSPECSKAPSDAGVAKVKDMVNAKVTSGAQAGGDEKNGGDDLQIVEKRGRDATGFEKEPTQTSFASRVQENIKRASVQKGNVDLSTEFGVEDQGHRATSEIRGGPLHYTSRKKSSPKNSFDDVKNSLLAWKTRQTSEYFSSGNDVDFRKKLLMQEKVARICQNLDEEEILENLDKSDSVGDGQKQKLPDYQDLAKKTHDYDLKVKEFFEGHLSYPVEGEGEAAASETLDNIAQGGVVERDIQWEPPLPLVDSQSQMSIRRKILLDGINRVLPSLLSTLKLIPRDVATSIKELVYTFRLSSHNIVFKPQELTLLAAVILKMLSLKDKNLQESFSSRSATLLLESLCDTFAFSHGDLDHLLQLMTSSDISTLD